MLMAKAVFDWIYEQVYNYNLFSSETNENNNGADDLEEPVDATERQKCTAWLYAALVIGK